MTIAVGTRLGHYQIRSALGAGGQGEVYQAIDTNLDRPVVIKVLTPSRTSNSATPARFEREARLASSLDHPNICTIHGLYEQDGVRFIAMQYVEGKNIRQFVSGRPLELASALSIAIQVTDALAAAHARGIIHRDIKAGNVMVTDAGLVKVLDFGLAKLVGHDEGEVNDDPHLTELGVPFGTATYAAPEQARGHPTDHRADIFSAGVLLYEMLTGMWPFKGKSTIEVRYAVLYGEPRPLAEARGEGSPVIARLQTLLDRALAKEPNERYQRIEDLRADLRAVLREIDPDISQGDGFASASAPVVPRHRESKIASLLRRRARVSVAIGTLLLVVGITTFIYLHRAPPPAIDSLAVLPFANVTADPNAEYLSDGITESLINSLSKLPTVKVRSRNTAFRYKGRAPDPQEVGRELGVNVVLTGQLEKRGDDLSISVELIDAKDDSHVWGARYTRKLADLPALQQELARAVADNLRLRLSGAEQQELVKNSATNAEAYQLYLQGRYHWNKRTAEDLQQGINYFTQAIERDSTYAPAYSGLADCYLLLNVYDIKPAMEANAKAREAATKALALDETLAEAHASLADVSYRYDWNWAEAEQHFKRAIELNADYATAHQWYSAMLAAEGRFDEANAEARRARELEPFSLTVNTVVGRRLYYARKFDEAQTAYRQTLDMDRNFVRAHVELGDTLMQTGQTAEAIAEFQQALALDKESISARAGLGYAYGVTGQRDKALQLVAQLQELGRRRYVSPYHLAVIHAGLGARTEALDELEQAAGERYAWLVFLRVEPQFDGLRSDPRFGALVRRVGLVR